MPQIDKLFQAMMAKKASDMHLTVGNFPMIRDKGELVPLAEWSITHDVLQGLLCETMREDQWQRALETHDFDYAYEIPDLARYRGNVFFNNQGMAAVFRTIPTRILTLEDLKLPPVFKELAGLRKGLVLVTGPTGSGKSTTLAAIINEINENRECNILTIEDPIEFTHNNKKSKVTQREIHRDTKSFKKALRSSMRQDPDIILVGEMRDYETISLALTAAETGTLVFGTLHTNSAAKTIDRIINVYPADERDGARALLASTLKAVIAQQLVPTADGAGRIAAFETLTFNPSLPNLIRTGKTSQIVSLIETGGSQGMQTMDQCLMNLVETRVISARSAYLKAIEKKIFLPMMEREGRSLSWGMGF